MLAIDCQNLLMDTQEWNLLCVVAKKNHTNFSYIRYWNDSSTIFSISKNLTKQRFCKNPTTNWRLLEYTFNGEIATFTSARIHELIQGCKNMTHDFKDGFC